jgi:hypothetical protein
MPNRAPDTGLPKTAAKPALTPEITRRRRSSSRKRGMSANRLARAAPVLRLVLPYRPNRQCARHDSCAELNGPP